MTAARREQIVCGVFTLAMFVSVLSFTWVFVGPKMVLSAAAFMAAFLIVMGLIAWAAESWVERGD